MLEIIGSLFTLVGAVFFLLSAIGLIRMPDAFNRMQAGTKATTLGSIMFLLGIGLMRPEYLGRTVILAVFIALTNPVSSNALARAAHAHRARLGARLEPDALADAELADAAAASQSPEQDSGSSEAHHGN